MHVIHSVILITSIEMLLERIFLFPLIFKTCVKTLLYLRVYDKVEFLIF